MRPARESPCSTWPFRSRPKRAPCRPRSGPSNNRPGGMAEFFRHRRSARFRPTGRDRNPTGRPDRCEGSFPTRQRGCDRHFAVVPASRGRWPSGSNSNAAWGYRFPGERAANCSANMSARAARCPSCTAGYPEETISGKQSPYNDILLVKTTTRIQGNASRQRKIHGSGGTARAGAIPGKQQADKSPESGRDAAAGRLGTGGISLKPSRFFMLAGDMV